MKTALKFLIVDDDVVCRNKMSAILAGVGECTVCEGGKEAVTEFCRAINDKERYDLISLDIGLPDIKGTDVLLKIRKIESDLKIEKRSLSKIIMITSHADRDNVRNSLVSGCDGYLVKPFNENILLEKLKEFQLVSDQLEEHDAISQQEGLSEAIKIAAKNLKTGSLDLLKPPDVYMKLKDMLDSGADMSSASDLLKSDMVITAKLINISNTSIYRGVKKNASLTDALARLGLREVLRQVCAICTRELYMDTEKKWEQYSNTLFQDAMVMAYSCEALKEYTCQVYDIDPYTMGLMRNIGFIYLLKVVEDFESNSSSSVSIEMDDVQPLLQKYSGSFGAALLKQWEMPSEYQMVARYCAGKANLKQMSKELELINLSIDLDAGGDDSKSHEVVQSVLSDYGEIYLNLELDSLLETRKKIKQSAKEAAMAIS